jgi:polyisoprenoid-binding protein YceI
MEQTMNQNRWLMVILLVVAMFASLAVSSPASATGTWSTDSAHTEINFSVNHFFTPVTGSFEDYDIDLAYDPKNPEKSTVEVRIKAASINTGNQKRDDHLRSEDWFEADKHPYLTFKSTSIRKVSDTQLIATGPLTIKGKSHQVELPITLLGTQMIPEQMQEMLGGTKNVASFQASTAIDRGDYGVGVGNWAATMVVGSEINIDILLEAHNR